jgi:uncharacterized membrane protein YtjA (UPF0391 family)
MLYYTIIFLLIALIAGATKSGAECCYGVTAAG